MEERFCSKVKELGCTCITISHRPALVAFHDLVLALDGEGGWSIHEGATGSFTEETIAEDGVAGNGGMQRSGGQGTADKARTKDADAVLQGMRVQPFHLLIYLDWQVVWVCNVSFTLLREGLVYSCCQLYTIHICKGSVQW